MNSGLKGALLSGLIIPGLGQFVLKHYVRGTVMMGTVLVSLTLIAVKTIQVALVILKKVQQEGGVINFKTVSDAAFQASTSFESLSFNSLFAVVLGCWIIGVFDAYIIGRKIDTE